jgi:hypothetical protein
MMRRLAARLLRLAGPRLGAALAGASALLLLSTAAAGATPTPGGQLTVHLERGWNNVPYYGPPIEPEVALAQIEGKYTAVWHWDALEQRYQGYVPAERSSSDLRTMQPGHAYWIYTTEPAELTVGTPRPGLVPALVPGWNNLVYTGPPLPVDEALHPLAGRYAAVYGWDAAAQRFRAAAPAPACDLTALAPYGCYWLRFS